MVLTSVACSVATADSLADFDDLTLAADSYWSGTYTVDGIGGNYDTAYFHSGVAAFENHSDGDWASWGGFAYSNKTDNITGDYTNQYSVYTAYAHSSENFAIGYQDAFNGYNPTVILDEPLQIGRIYVTNTTYTAITMRDGYLFAKKFGGTTGDDEDWFLLTITGRDEADQITGAVDFFLADFRFEDNAEDYIIDDWAEVDLSSLGTVKSIEFTFTSSDTGQFGINTPTYFALDTIYRALTPLEAAIADIEMAIGIKEGAMLAIDEAMAVLINLLDAEQGGLDTARVRQKTISAMRHQVHSKKELQKSIDKLYEVLDMLTASESNSHKKPRERKER